MKIIFKKPKQKKILIFDRVGLDMFKLFFYHSQFDVLDRRKETINIYIILKTIFNDGFKDFKSNYFKNYLNTVNPKIVLTFIDNNFRFFLLKKTFPTAKYICIQNGMRDSRYFSDLKRFKKIHKDLEIDYYFTYSRQITKKISPLIKCRYFNTGSIINNCYSLDQKLKEYDFKKSITFI
jgi:surface carbohydrate biosynthesis protein